MAVEKIGCCGAYCGTCRAFADSACRGCKLGYESGERDLSKAKCRIKICCLSKDFLTCADCADYAVCQLLQGFYDKDGRKYKKYRQTTECIRQQGYTAFLEIAGRWTNASGKYEFK